MDSKSYELLVNPAASAQLQFFDLRNLTQTSLLRREVQVALLMSDLETGIDEVYVSLRRLFRSNRGTKSRHIHLVELPHGVDEADS